MIRLKRKILAAGWRIDYRGPGWKKGDKLQDSCRGLSYLCLESFLPLTVHIHKMAEGPLPSFPLRLVTRAGDQVGGM